MARPFSSVLVGWWGGLRENGLGRLGHGLHVLHLGRGRYSHLHGAQRGLAPCTSLSSSSASFSSFFQILGASEGHLHGVVGGVVVAVVGEEAGEEERHGQSDAPDAEEHQADQLAHVQRGVVALGARVDVPLPGWLVLSHDDSLGRHEVADQDAHHPEEEQVHPDPHEDLPPDGRAAAAAGVGVQEVYVVVVLVDGGVLVAAVAVVEVVQIGPDPEGDGAAPLALAFRAGHGAGAGRLRPFASLFAGFRCTVRQTQHGINDTAPQHSTDTQHGINDTTLQHNRHTAWDK